MADDPSFGFYVDWHDAQADIMRKYNLTVFEPRSGDLEAAMYDPKTKRQFLKRMPIPELRLEDCHVGSTVTIFARQLKVTGYTDQRTEAALNAKRGGVTLLTTPDAYGELGKIVAFIEGRGLTIGRLRLVNAGGPVAAIEVLGSNVESKWDEVWNSLPPGAVNEVSAADAATYFEDRAHFPCTAAFDNCTLAVIRPHAVKAGKVGEIVSAIQEAGFEISAAQMVHLKKEQATEFLEVYKGVLPYHSDLVNVMSAGPCLALELRAPPDGGLSVVEKFRQLCGPHDVDMAKHLRPNSLRARFGLDNARNGVHSTDLEDDAESEVRYIFEMLS